jgi:ABC-type glycerol-3-phosphate transport system permease component
MTAKMVSTVASIGSGLRGLGKHFVLIVLLVLMLVPLYLLLIDAGKTTHQFDAHPLTLTLPYHFEHYMDMVRGMYRYIVNSAIISLISIPLALGLASYAAYTFARFSFPGREFLYYAIIMLMMIPFVLSLVPQYVLVLRLGLMNTRWALVFPYAAGGTVFGVFLMRPFIASLNEEFFEAARIDGASALQEYWWIALPLCKPILATLSIMLLLSQWNDLIWPAVTLHDKGLYTVTLGVFSLASTIFAGGAAAGSQTQWGHMFAAFVISAVPIFLVFVVARKAFIEGLTSGALKF